jgi:hypothetical protein
MLTVSIMLVLLLRFISVELAILISTFIGCCLGILVEGKNDNV